MTDSPSSSSATPNHSTINRNLTIKPFITQTDSNDTAVLWQKYKKEIERQFRFFGITDPETKKDGLLIYGGHDLVDIDDALPDITGTEHDDAYKLLLRKIDNHLIPKKNKDFARFQLSELKQQSSERLTDYYAKIRNIAKKCEYADHEDDTIRDHLIRTMLNHKIRSKAIRENWALDKILTEAAIDEQTTEQADTINKKINEEITHERIKKLAMRKTTRPPIKDDACARCGNSKQHTTCPAIGVSCDNCGKKNHYAGVCFGKSKHNFANRNPKHRPGHNKYRSASQNIRDKRDYHDDKRETSQTRRTRHIGNNHSDDSSSDDEYFLNHLKTHPTSKDNADKWKTCTIQINGVSIVAEPDSGSDTNIMDESQFANLQKQEPELKIKATKIKT